MTWRVESFFGNFQLKLIFSFDKIYISKHTNIFERDESSSICKFIAILNIFSHEFEESSMFFAVPLNQGLNLVGGMFFGSNMMIKTFKVRLKILNHESHMKVKFN